VKVRFLADADLNRVIVSGVLRREPSLDFLTAQAAGAAAHLAGIGSIGVGKPAGVAAALKLTRTRVMLQARMTDDRLLYESWRIPGSYFNRMLDCGDRYDQWAQIALECFAPRHFG